MTRRTTSTLLLTLTALSAAITGCAPALSERDVDALTALGRVAGPTSGIDADQVAWTECWLPSDHLLPESEVGNDTTWKVLCRVHWREREGAERYQDTTCIGDFAADPMLDHCYRWTHYDQEPVFEDHDGVRVSTS